MKKLAPILVTTISRIADNKDVGLNLIFEAISKSDVKF